MVHHSLAKQGVQTSLTVAQDARQRQPTRYEGVRARKFPADGTTPCKTVSAQSSPHTQSHCKATMRRDKATCCVCKGVPTCSLLTTSPFMVAQYANIWAQHPRPWERAVWEMSSQRAYQRMSITPTYFRRAPRSFKPKRDHARRWIQLTLRSKSHCHDAQLQTERQ